MSAAEGLESLLQREIRGPEPHPLAILVVHWPSLLVGVAFVVFLGLSEFLLAFWSLTSALKWTKPVPEALGRPNWRQMDLEGMNPYKSSNGALSVLECWALLQANSNNCRTRLHLASEQRTTQHLLDLLVRWFRLAMRLRMVRRGHLLLDSEEPA